MTGVCGGTAWCCRARQGSQRRRRVLTCGDDAMDVGNGFGGVGRCGGVPQATRVPQHGTTREAPSSAWWCWRTPTAGVLLVETGPAHHNTPAPAPVYGRRTSPKFDQQVSHPSHSPSCHRCRGVHVARAMPPNPLVAVTPVVPGSGLKCVGFFGCLRHSIFNLCLVGPERSSHSRRQPWRQRSV
jgi:hypothetical protein